jgi:DNA recombination protein RmuC
MNIEFILLLVFIIVGFSGLVYFLNRKLSDSKSDQSDEVLVKWLQSMQSTLEQNSQAMTSALNQNNKNVSDTLLKTTQQINQRLENATKIIGDTSRELTKMNELGSSIKDLQMILKAPKLRGNLGEEILTEMITQIFPQKFYQFQYGFKSGAKVDAVLKTTAGLLCIDSKFPVENYQKQLNASTQVERKRFETQFINDVRKHIRDISGKYILPDEKTVDFAFMYVPSEAIFYEVAKLPELFEYARSQRVYPVSPNTLYAHLQTVLLAFEGQKIEENAKQVIRLLKSLQKDYDKMSESVVVLGKHLTNASNQYQNTFTHVSLMGQKLNQQNLLESK